MEYIHYHLDAPVIAANLSDYIDGVSVLWNTHMHTVVTGKGKNAAFQILAGHSTC